MKSTRNSSLTKPVTSLCNICGVALDQPVYASDSPISVTSLCEIRREKIAVHFCHSCGHLQTVGFKDLDAYYDEDYKILVSSTDEDQLYSQEGGRKIFRTEHQMRCILQKINIPSGARVLDYGCAKSSTLRALTQSRPDIIPHVFDVSDMYLPFWRDFIHPDNWAVYQPKPEWKESFDLITSFFALEHVADPVAFIKTVSNLLKPGGYFYFLVPNVYQNTADLVVADHVNHFSDASLHRLLESNGLALESIDSAAHTSAWVVVAQKRPDTISARIESKVIPDLHDQAVQMAAYWTSFGGRIREFEAQHSDHQKVAIYGSGFYGTFIASSLRDTSRVECFMDMNPHRHAHTLLDKPICSPEKLPADVRLIYVGLNPVHARKAIESLTCWNGRQLTCFYP